MHKPLGPKKLARRVNQALKDPLCRVTLPAGNRGTLIELNVLLPHERALEIAKLVGENLSERAPNARLQSGFGCRNVANMATSHGSPYRHYLREWREHCGFKQEELAALTGISSSVISRYETGNRRIHTETQFKLMQALGITPSQFFSPPTGSLTKSLALAGG